MTAPDFSKLSFSLLASVFLASCADSSTSGRNEAAATHPPASFDMPKPHYPAELRSKGLQDRVVVKFTVGASGDVTSAKVLSATYPSAGQAALEAIYRWKFSPGKGDATVVKTVDFRIYGHRR